MSLFPTTVPELKRRRVVIKYKNPIVDSRSLVTSGDNRDVGKRTSTVPDRFDLG